MKTKRGGVGRWIVIGVLVLAVAGVAFALYRRNAGPDLERTLVERLETGAFRREVSGTGVVEAKLERTLSFKTPGTVDSILVSEGDTVEAGATLAQLDVSSIERDLASSRASLQSARADLSRLNAQQEVDRIDAQSAVENAQNTLSSAREALSNAQQTLATQQRLFETGAASQNALTQAREAVASAERQVSSAELGLQSAQTRQGSFDQLVNAQRSSATAQISQLETTIANLEESLSETTLTAPFAGTVATLDFEVGDTVGTGAGGTLRLVDTSSLLVTANFDENRSAELRPGQKATITPDANASRRLAASVRRVGTVANRSTGSAQLETILDFDDLGEAASLVRPGYTVTARIELNALENTLLIPLEAITETEDEAYVFLVEESEPGEGTATKASVTVLDRNATIAAAESTEVGPGDLIAVINLEELEDAEGVSYEPLEDAASDPDL